MHILELTPSLRAQIEAQMSTAFYGDGDVCDQTNMSCFAPEACNLGKRGVQRLDASRMQGGGTYVMLDGETFVGCITVAKGSRQVALPPGPVLYDFCVAHAYQGNGCGRQLMQHVQDKHPGQRIFCLVRKLDQQHAPLFLKQVFEDRVDRLTHTYCKMSFLPFLETDDFKVFVLFCPATPPRESGLLYRRS